MIIAALLLLAAQQPVNDPAEDSTFSERQPVRLAAMPAARAFAAFRDICMTNFPDPAAFDSAAAASDLGFTRAANPERGAQEWTSGHGQIIFRMATGRDENARRDRREGRTMRRRWLARCDFWVAIEENLEAPALVGRIGAELLGGRARANEEIVGTSWDLGATPGGALKLVYLPSNDDPRLFTLSLQLLPEGPAP